MDCLMFKKCNTDLNSNHNHKNSHQELAFEIFLCQIYLVMYLFILHIYCDPLELKGITHISSTVYKCNIQFFTYIHI